MATLRTVGEATIRNRDYGDAPYLIPGLLYFGATVIYADGGLGKTVFAHALEHHLAYGRPFGGWITDQRTRCLVVSLEDDERQVAERSFRLMPTGGLDTDGRPEQTEAPGWSDMIEHSFYVAGDDFDRRLDNLRLHLTAEAEAGRPFGYVRIDTYGDFVGGKPRDTNAYEWDKHCTTRLNKLALQFDMAIVLIHHTNKKGEFSGSEGLRGGVTTLAVLERSTENPDDEAVLRAAKCRVAAEFAYTLRKSESGIWEFTDDVRPTEVELQGMSRSCFSILARGVPMSRHELSRQFTVPVNQNSLQVCLSRLKRKGILTFIQGQWRITQMRADEGRLPRRCKADCGQPLLEDLYGDGYHATCSPSPPQPGPSPAPPPPPGEGLGNPIQPELGDGQEQEPAPPALPRGVIICGPRQISESDADAVREFAASLEEKHALEVEREFFGDEAVRRSSQGSYKVMRDSIQRSRMKPLPSVPKTPNERIPGLGIRTEAPWTLVQERMDGAHRWTAESLPEGGWVTALDRTGSFPSACSSVPVAPNVLHHTEDPEHLTAETRKTMAGIWRILVPEWDEREHRIGHPLGRLSEDGPGAEVWITSAHLEHLDGLVAKGRIEPVTVLEAWAGRRSTSLFERFSENVRKTYAMPESDERTAGKTGASQAIRALWTKQARSPWHRPDWNTSIRAEASVRHWIRADQAVTAGARLLALGATDEAIIWTAEEPDAGWVPQPYILGTKFGEVKIKAPFKGAPKSAVPLTDWKESLRGHRKR